MQPTDPTGSATGEPTWEIAELFPRQGHWSEGEYLSIKSNRLMELSKGRLEMLPMPTQSHQLIVAFLYQRLLEFVTVRQLGLVLFAPLRVKVGDGQIREPDIVFMSEANKHRRNNEFWLGADLVIEVVSNDDPKRDLEVKRHEYAQAGIPEYWIVDPRNSTTSILRLAAEGSSYIEAGAYKSGDVAASVLLEGLTIDVAAIFAAANE
ncbi:MAG: Uma2 family endonuclease [Planctomycetaceae bacterium]|nr:Uma2 family endonuclease [Planctomycetaceae bacterium]MCB9937848.1 Uma2 family endonuclease [Planctomycetaceae bacterium]